MTVQSLALNKKDPNLFVVINDAYNDVFTQGHILKQSYFKQIWFNIKNIPYYTKLWDIFRKKLVKERKKEKRMKYEENDVGKKKRKLYGENVVRKKERKK